MQCDALTVTTIVAELRQALVGGKLQRVLLPNEWSVGLEVYANGQRHQLLLSAHPQHPRLHLVQAKLSRGGERVTPLLLLLRKYVRNGRVVRIEQPAFERVVALSIAKFPSDRKDDDEDEEALAEPSEVELIFEMIGRQSNILLVDDDNLILECVRHVHGDGARRALLPRAPYELPPRQHKLNPATVTANGIRSLLAQGAPTLAKALVAGYDGVSPQLGQEVAARTLGDPRAPLREDAPLTEIAETLALLATGGERRPCLARDEAGQVLAVAPYWLHQHAQVEAQPSLNAAVEQAYAELEQLTNHQQRREQALAELGGALGRAQRRVEALSQEIARAGKLEQLRWEGEMIYGFLHAIEPGQKELQVEERTIALDPQLSPSENAQARFRQYDKAKSAMANLPELLEQAQAQQGYLEQSMALLELADRPEEIDLVIAEAQERGMLKPPPGKRPKPPRSGPLKLHTPEGALIMVGRSALQNDEITFKHGRPDDLWLHARGIAGAHVLLRFDGEDPPDESILRAAELAAYFSKGRHAGAVEVDISRRRHVRRIPGGQPGLVTYQPFRTIRVEPRLMAE